MCQKKPRQYFAKLNLGIDWLTNYKFKTYTVDGLSATMELFWNEIKGTEAISTI